MMRRPSPSTVWFCWLQGISQAPAVVRLCERSWRLHNPNWELRLLEQAFVRDFCLTHSGIAPDQYDALPPQKQTNILRINLLAQEGGVWADATCLCLRPLDEWLWEYLIAGFFAFRDPAPDRLLSNWFLAAEPENELVSGQFRTCAGGPMSKRNACWRYVAVFLCCERPRPKSCSATWSFARRSSTPTTSFITTSIDTSAETRGLGESSRQCRTTARRTDTA